MKPILRLVLAALAAMACTAALAHSGHGFGALATGLAHLMTPEHLLPLLAVIGLLVLAGLGAKALLKSRASGSSATREGKAP